LVEIFALVSNLRYPYASRC